MSAILVATGIVVFITHGLEAITGFGCTVLAMPFVTMLLGIEEAKFLLAVLAWVLALYFVVTKFRFIVWDQFLLIIAFVGAGMPFGMWAFASLDRRVLGKALGVFILLSAGLQLWKRIFRPIFLGLVSRSVPPTGRSVPEARSVPPEGRPLPAPVYWALLFVGGIVHGAFATGGPLVVLYASRALPNKGNFRSTLTLLWAVLNTALIVQFALGGKFTGEAWGTLGLMAPFLVGGIVAGEVAHHRVDSDFFAKIVFAMLFVTGVIMVVA